jgi:nucleoside-triphosphatase THEP1
MEFGSKIFLHEIVKLFCSEKTILAVIQQRALERYLDLIGRNKYSIFTVNFSSRNVLKSGIIKCLSQLPILR